MKNNIVRRLYKRKKKALSLIFLSLCAAVAFLMFIQLETFGYNAPVTIPGGDPHAIGISAQGGLSKRDIAYINNRLDQMVDLGVTWVRFDIEWSYIQPQSKDEFQWENYDVLIQAIKAHKLEPLGLVIFTPAWAREADCTGGVKCPPKDPQEFATFMGHLASRYKKQVKAWEVWNEPNNVGFWATGADCKAYTELLKATYPSIKKANSNALVITGGLAPVTTSSVNMTQVDFVRCMSAEGAQGYFDALGDHPYTFPKLPSEGSNAWSQMNTLRNIMISYGDANKKIWLTEVGAPTHGPDPYWYVSEEKQAEIVEDALELHQNYDWVGPLFWYSLIDEGTSPTTIENFFGLKDFDGNVKPAYTRLKMLLKKR